MIFNWSSQRRLQGKLTTLAYQLIGVLLTLSHLHWLWPAVAWYVKFDWTMDLYPLHAYFEIVYVAMLHTLITVEGKDKIVRAEQEQSEN